MCSDYAEYMAVHDLYSRFQFLWMGAEDDAVFLQGMLEGMTRIEAEAYTKLASMGASKLKKVFLVRWSAASSNKLMLKTCTIFYTVP